MSLFNALNRNTWSAPLDGCSTLADPITEIMELGPANASGLSHLYLGDLGRVKKENTLDSLIVSNFADSEGLADTLAIALKDDSSENLDPLFATLDNTCVNLDLVANSKVGDLVFHLFFLDLIDDVHAWSRKEINLPRFGERRIGQKILPCKRNSWYR